MEEKPKFLKANPLLPAPGDVFLYFDKILQIPRVKDKFYISERKKTERFAVQGKMAIETADEIVKARYNDLKQHVERFPGELGIDFLVLLNYLFIREEGQHYNCYSFIIEVLQSIIKIIKSSPTGGVTSNEDVKNFEFYANYEMLFGEFWYLPDIDSETGSLIYPTQKVLNKLVEFCPNGENDIINNDSSDKESIDDSIEFRKQFRRWKNKGKNISRDSIEKLILQFSFRSLPKIGKSEQFGSNLKHALLRAQAVTYLVKDIEKKYNQESVKKLLELFYELYPRVPSKNDELVNIFIKHDPL